MEVLHRAGARWVDLTDTLLDHVQDGGAVVWVSFSGTTQLFARGEGGALTRTRHGASGSSHPGDGWPLEVLVPFHATACGCADASGYRSTPPLLVAAIARPDDVDQVTPEAASVAARLRTDGYDPDAVPVGHPRTPCGALYCPQITPQAIQDSEDRR